MEKDDDFEVPVISFDADPILVFRVIHHYRVEDHHLYRATFQAELDNAGLGDRKFIVVSSGVEVTSV